MDKSAEMTILNSRISQSGRHNSLLQPTDAWALIIGYGLLNTLLAFVGAGKIVNLAFPIGGVIVAAFLCQRYPVLYIGFSWWVILLSPLLRRLADFHGSFTDPSPILLTPYLVVWVIIIPLWNRWPTILSKDGFPFALSIAGIIYATFVGFVNLSINEVFVGLLDYLSPIFFGIYIYVLWPKYNLFRNHLIRLIPWTILILGAYGIYQYFSFPPWDQAWVENTKLSSIGGQEAENIRIWSTLNSSEPFGAYMAAALLLVFNIQSFLLPFAIPVGYISLLLTLVRSAWLGWIGGILTLTTSLRPKLQMRLLITILVMTILVVPFVMGGSYSDRILDRVGTLSSLQNDGSGQIRLNTYQELYERVTVAFVGDGIGGPTYDSALLGTIINLGWIGVLPYATGIILLIIALFQGNEYRHDPFIAAARAITVSCLVRLPVNVVLQGASGTLFWFFLAFGLAGRRYAIYQKTQSNNSSRAAP